MRRIFRFTTNRRQTRYILAKSVANTKVQVSRSAHTRTMHMKLELKPCRDRERGGDRASGSERWLGDRDTVVGRVAYRQCELGEQQSHACNQEQRDEHRLHVSEAATAKHTHVLLAHTYTAQP